MFVKQSQVTDWNDLWATMLFSFFFLLNFQRFGSPIPQSLSLTTYTQLSLCLCKLWIWDLCSYMPWSLSKTSGHALQRNQKGLSQLQCTPLFMRQARNHVTHFKCQESCSQQQPKLDLRDLGFSRYSWQKSTTIHLSPHVLGAGGNEQLAQNKPESLSFSTDIFDCHALECRE